MARAVPAASSLVARVDTLIRFGGEAAPQVFDRLALDVFAFQYGRDQRYRRLCDERGVSPRTVTHWREVPAVPPQHPTTQRPAPIGDQPDDDALLLALAAQAQLAGFAAAVLPDRARLPLLVLDRPTTEGAIGFVSAFAGQLAQAFGNGCTYYADNAGLALRSLVHDLVQAEAEGTPLLLIGSGEAVFKLIQFCQAANVQLALPARSRLLDLGAGAALPPHQLHRRCRRVLGIAASHMVNAYVPNPRGSMYFDAALADHCLQRKAAPRKIVPAWASFQLCDGSGRPLPPNESPGRLALFDLAALSSPAKLQTGARAWSEPDGFALAYEAADGAE